MVYSFPYEKLLQQCLEGELRIVNSSLAQKQKSLHDLLNETHPHIISCDGNVYSFKKKELQYIASLITPEEEKELLLPIIIEIGTIPSEAVILCQSEVEVNVISKLLGMTMVSKDNRIKLYRPQLALLRKMAKTTTQYVFSPLTIE
jgi:uncharacterized protein (UPF0216 family)